MTEQLGPEAGDLVAAFQDQAEAVVFSLYGVRLASLPEGIESLTRVTGWREKLGKANFDRPKKPGEVVIRLGIELANTVFESDLDDLRRIWSRQRHEVALGVWLGGKDGLTKVDDWNIDRVAVVTLQRLVGLERRVGMHKLDQDLINGRFLFEDQGGGRWILPLVRAAKGAPGIDLVLVRKVTRAEGKTSFRLAVTDTADGLFEKEKREEEEQVKRGIVKAIVGSVSPETIKRHIFDAIKGRWGVEPGADMVAGRGKLGVVVDGDTDALGRFVSNAVEAMREGEEEERNFEVKRDGDNVWLIVNGGRGKVGYWLDYSHQVQYAVSIVAEELADGIKERRSIVDNAVSQEMKDCLAKGIRDDRTIAIRAQDVLTGRIGRDHGFHEMELQGLVQVILWESFADHFNIREDGANQVSG